MGYHKLRLVGWYRSRWNFNFCGMHSVSDGGWRLTVLQKLSFLLFKRVYFNYTWGVHGWRMGFFAYTESIWFLWVNFNSPLLWDVFAISTYLSVSLVFWWTGLLPDFAMLRDRAITLSIKEFILY
jgi:hypothetical protein